MSSPYLGRATSHPITAYKKVTWLADSLPASLAIPRMQVSFSKPHEYQHPVECVDKQYAIAVICWECHFPPPCEKCPAQASLPGSPQPCAETLACEDVQTMQEIDFQCLVQTHTRNLGQKSSNKGTIQAAQSIMSAFYSVQLKIISFGWVHAYASQGSQVWVRGPNAASFAP